MKIGLYSSVNVLAFATGRDSHGPRITKTGPVSYNDESSDLGMGIFPISDLRDGTVVESGSISCRFREQDRKDLQDVNTYTSDFGEITHNAFLEEVS